MDYKVVLEHHRGHYVKNANGKLLLNYIITWNYSKKCGRSFLLKL